MILIVGRGWIGTKLHRAIVARGERAVAVSHDEAFVSIANTRPDVVVNCAAVTGSPNIGACENQKARTIEGNALFPVLLHRECFRQCARFYHFSSGCIFNGGTFDEFDPPNFDGNTYVAAKRVSDECLVSSGATVFRVRLPFDGTHHERNLLTKFEEYSATGVLVDSVNSLSDADEMVTVAARIILSDAPAGPYNLVNNGAISTKEIARRMGLKARWIEWPEFERLHGPRSACELGNSRARKIMNIRDVSDAIDSAIARYRNERAAA